MRIFKYSGVQDLCTRENLEGYHLLENSAYTLQKYVITPYKDNRLLDFEGKNFNKKNSQIRCMVECCIGLLKCRWRWILDKFSLSKIKPIPYSVTACCILHNICLKNDDELEYNINLPEPPMYLGPNVPRGAARRRGRRIRDAVSGFFYGDIM